MGLFDSITNFFTFDIGVDLGTSTTLVSVKDIGIVSKEPSVVAINKRDDIILAVGNEAKEMIGRTPGDIVAVRPLRSGVISDFPMTEAMLKYFINKAQLIARNDNGSFWNKFKLGRPRVVVGIPSGITEVEKRAVYDAAMLAGAREVYIIEEAMAAAIGSNLPIGEPTGSMVIDIGGGTSDIAIISLGEVVVDTTIRVAGDEIDQEIARAIRNKFNLQIGDRTAEDLKINIANLALAIPDYIDSQILKAQEVESKQENKSEILRVVEEPVLVIEEDLPIDVHDIYETTETFVQEEKDDQLAHSKLSDSSVGLTNINRQNYTQDIFVSSDDNYLELDFENAIVRDIVDNTPAEVLVTSSIVNVLDEPKSEITDDNSLPAEIEQNGVAVKDESFSENLLYEGLVFEPVDLRYLRNNFEMEIKGRDISTGLPKAITVKSSDILEDVVRVVEPIIDAAKEAIGSAPPEILGDILVRGVILAGGGTLLKGFQVYLQSKINTPVYIVKDPVSAVVRGCNTVLSNIDLLRQIQTGDM